MICNSIAVLAPLQHGFHANHFCENHLLLTTKDLVQNNQEIIQSDVMALDFITYIFTLDPKKFSRPNDCFEKSSRGNWLATWTYNIYISYVNDII